MLKKHDFLIFGRLNGVTDYMYSVCFGTRRFSGATRKELHAYIFGRRYIQQLFYDEGLPCLL